MRFGGHQGIRRFNGSEAEAWLTYTCGHCGRDTSGAVVTAAEESQTGAVIRWLWCSGCGMPSVQLPDGSIVPGAAFGPDIEGLPPEVEAAYEESRQCFSVHAFIACDLLCRRMLIHIAVEKGAKEGENFTAYVDYLEQQGFTTPAMEGWVDMIRKLGNSSAHSLTKPDEARAKSILMFTVQLLRTVYEMPYLAQTHQTIP